MMEFSKLSCCSVVLSILPPPPAPEHTEEELLSTASPSASSTSLSIRSLQIYKLPFVSSMSFFYIFTHKLLHSSCYLRHTRIAAVLFLPEPILLYEDVKALRLLPHVIKRYAFGYCSCCDLRGQKNIVIKQNFSRFYTYF